MPTTQTLVSGNDIAAREFSYTVNGYGPSITAASFAVKNEKGVQIYKAACAFTGSTVTRPIVADEVIATWGVGVLSWDIKITYLGINKTYIRGTFTILKTDQ